MAKNLSMYSITENIYTHSCPPLRYFCSLNLTFSHRIVQGKDCVLSLCAIVLRSSPPSHVSTSNGHRNSQLFCVHYRSMPSSTITLFSGLTSFDRKSNTYFVLLQRYFFTFRKATSPNIISGPYFRQHLCYFHLRNLHNLYVPYIDSCKWKSTNLGLSTVA
jgi:hypothetical protein